MIVLNDKDNGGDDDDDDGVSGDVDQGKDVEWL